MEALDLSVGLRPVGPGEFVLDVAEGVVEEPGPVAGSVVGHHTQHGDAVGGVEHVGALPEPGGGFLLLVGQDLGIDQPGVVVDRGVQEGMANSGTPVSFVGLPTAGAVTAAVGDAAEFLHVHVHEIARILAFVADWFGFANRQTGVQVDVTQEGHVVSVEHLRHRRLRQAQVVADPVWSPPSGEAQRDDPPLGVTIGPRP